MVRAAAAGAGHGAEAPADTAAAARTGNPRTGAKATLKASHYKTSSFLFTLQRTVQRPERHKRLDCELQLPGQAERAAERPGRGAAEPQRAEEEGQQRQREGGHRQQQDGAPARTMNCNLPSSYSFFNYQVCLLFMYNTKNLKTSKTNKVIHISIINYVCLFYNMLSSLANCLTFISLNSSQYLK